MKQILKVLAVILKCGKMNTVKEIEKPFLSYQLTKRLFTQTLKSDCTNRSNISLFTFQVFLHKKFPNRKIRVTVQTGYWTITLMHTKRKKTASWRLQVSQQLQGGTPSLERNFDFAVLAVWTVTTFRTFINDILALSCFFCYNMVILYELFVCAFL